MGVGIVVICGISLGLIYIYKSVCQAGEDMETFDGITVAQKFKKPEGWKVGKLPAELNPIKQQVQVNRTERVA